MRASSRPLRTVASWGSRRHRPGPHGGRLPGSEPELSAGVTPVLRVEGLTVRYGRRQPFTAVDDISFEVPAGSVTGLVGESGSGKSTTASAVARLTPAAAGRISLLGEDIAALSLREFRPRRIEMQMIFQDPQGSLDPRQRVRSGLRELRRLHPERTSWLDDESLMQRVGLAPTLLDRVPHELSGGQAQRVCIARALLTRPRLIVADEPTSALDVSVQAQILELLRQLVDEEGISILFISHNLAVVRALCDFVHVMHTGQIVEAGPVEDVLTRPQHAYTRRLIDAIPVPA